MDHRAGNEIRDYVSVVELSGCHLAVMMLSSLPGSVKESNI